MRQLSLKLGLACLCASVALILPFWIFSPVQCTKIAMNCSYWLLSLLFFYFMWILITKLKNRLHLDTLWRSHRLGIIAIVLGASFLHLHEKREFKILYDEYVISGVAKQMHFEHTAAAPIVAHRNNDRLSILETFVDKRPVFFPYLLSLLHSVSGFRVGNVFILNSGLIFLFLTLVYSIVQRITNSNYGILSVLLLTTLPLLNQNVNGGGYEILNLCFILILMGASFSYLTDRSPENLNFLIISALLLSNIRYESILYLLVPVVVVAFQWVRDRSLNLTWFAVISPLFVTLPLCVNRVFYSREAFFSGKANDFFGIHYIPDNLLEAVTYLFDISSSYTNSVLLSLLGIISIVFLLVYFVKSIRLIVDDEPNLIIFYIFLFLVGGITILALSNFWGAWTDPTTSRFSLPFHLMMTFSISVVLYFRFQVKNLHRSILFVPVVFAVLMSATVAAKSIDRVELIAKSGEGWALKYLEKNVNRDNSLIVGGNSTCYILYDFASVPMLYFNQKPQKYHAMVELGIYQNIYVIQVIRTDPIYNKEIDISSVQLNKNIKLEFVAEYKIRPNRVYRISRVVVDVSLNPLIDRMSEDLILEEGYTESEYGVFVRKMLQ